MLVKKDLQISQMYDVIRQCDLLLNSYIVKNNLSKQEINTIANNILKDKIDYVELATNNHKSHEVKILAIIVNNCYPLLVKNKTIKFTIELDSLALDTFLSMITHYPIKRNKLDKDYNLITYHFIMNYSTTNLPFNTWKSLYAG